MSKPSDRPTPAGRVDRWKKLWNTPRPLSDSETEEAFDQFREALVPKHMHKQFMKTFGVPKAAFGNRFFVDEVVFRDWETRFSSLIPSSVETVEAIVLYGSPDSLEAWRIAGQTRRTLKDLFIDDWHAACAVIHAGSTTLYAFIEPKMRGSIVRTVRSEEDEEESFLLEHDSSEE